MSNYLRPSEIAKQKLITNSKGKGDYRYILRLIESGRLKAKDRALSGDKPYYMVHKDDIERYREEWVLMTTPEYIGLPTTTDEESPENRTNHYRTNKMMLEMGFTWCKDGFWENAISYRYDQKQATDLVDRIMNLITLHTQEAEVKAEIKGKVAAYNQMIMGAGEYHDDPYRYVVPIEHISEYLAGLMKFDLASSNPIYREKASPTPQKQENYNE